MAQTEDRESTDDEALPDDAALIKLTGDTPKIRMLLVLLAKKNQDLNKSDLADFAGIDRTSVYNHLDDLLELGVIEKTRDVGNSPFYALNKDSEIADDLTTLEYSTIQRMEEIYTDA